MENFQDAKACKAKNGVSDAGSACRLNGTIKEFFEGGFDDVHLVEGLVGFKVLAFCLVAFIFSGKGGVNDDGAMIDGVNPWSVAVHGIDSRWCNHVKPSMLPHPPTAG